MYTHKGEKDIHTQRETHGVVRQGRTSTSHIGPSMPGPKGIVLVQVRVVPCVLAGQVGRIAHDLQRR